jgi:hypothetical protein
VATLVAFLFGVIAVIGIKLLGRSRAQRQFAKVEALIAVEREDLARRQAANPAVWSAESAESFLGALHDELRSMGATQVEQVSEASVERTIYEIDQFALTLIRANGTWEVWLGWDERHDFPASFWIGALAGSEDVPDREADYVALAQFAHQLPAITRDRTRLAPLVTAIGQRAHRRFRADLRSSP